MRYYVPPEALEDDEDPDPIERKPDGEMFCPVCYKEFEDEDTRDNHVENKHVL